MNTRNRYYLYSKASGHEFGIYEAHSAWEAYLELMSDAGYPTTEHGTVFDEMGKEISELPEDIGYAEFYRNPDHFIDSMGGDRQDLVNLVLSCDSLSEFCNKLPYSANENDTIIQQFYRKIVFDYEAFIHSLDDEFREKLHNELAPCTKKEFLDRAYDAVDSYRNCAEDLGLI